MIQSARSLAFHFARVGAIAFALTACGYLVVTAQRRANPVVEEEHPASDLDGLPTAVPTESDATFLPSSKVLIIDGPGTLESNGPPPLSIEWKPDDPTFLLGTKSAALPSATFDAVEEDLLNSENVSSKLGRDSNTGALTSGGSEPATTPASSQAKSLEATGATSRAEPVFLPSSKARTLSPLRPQTLVPGTTSTSERVFLPSSKSLRIGEGKGTTRGPAPNPAPTPTPMPTPAPTPAPTEPPKNR